MLAQKKDTVFNKSAKPTGIRIGTDILSIIRSPLDDSYSGWEVSTDVDFYRYFLTAEFGQWGRDFVSEDQTYTNDGTYWRIGVDVNFLKRDPEKNMFFLGARYANGTYTETLTILQNQTWNYQNYGLENSAVSAQWFELTGGLRVKMWKNLWMGYTARYKFALSADTEGLLVSTDVPGYGSTEKKNTWGFNYQVLFRIPFSRKQNKPGELIGTK